MEFALWPCPLTVAEQYFESRAGLPLYQGSFLVHYLDATVKPIPSPAWSAPSLRHSAPSTSAYTWQALSTGTCSGNPSTHAPLTSSLDPFRWSRDP